MSRIKRALAEFEEALEDHAEAIRDLEAYERRTDAATQPLARERGLRARQRRLDTVHRRFLRHYQGFLSALPERAPAPHAATTETAEGAVQAAL